MKILSFIYLKFFLVVGLATYGAAPTSDSSDGREEHSSRLVTHPAVTSLSAAAASAVPVSAPSTAVPASPSAPAGASAPRVSLLEAGARVSSGGALAGAAAGSADEDKYLASAFPRRSFLHTQYLNIRTGATSQDPATMGDDVYIKCYVARPSPSKSVPGRNPVLFMTGRGGCAEDPYYMRAIVNFAEENGVEVHSFDWPYQGRSARHPDNPDAVHTESFEIYDAALESFIKFVMKDHNKKDGIDVMAISMGGCNVINYCKNHKDNLFFRKIVTLAPMVSFYTHNIPSFIVRGICSIANYFGYGKYTAPMQEKSKEKKEKLERLKDLPVAVTFSWLRAARQAAYRAKEGPGSGFSIPMLTVIPKDDKVVPMWDQIQHAEGIRSKGSKTAVVYGSPHDVLFVDDPARQNPILKMASQYFYGAELKDGRMGATGPLEITIHSPGFDTRPYGPYTEEDEEDASMFAFGLLAATSMMGSGK